MLVDSTAVETEAAKEGAVVEPRTSALVALA